jgi:mRNA interferase MazF
MVPSSAGAIVLVRFPFSNLSQSKLRPAVVLADAGRGDWILCQVTSNPYADSRAIMLSDESFHQGGLQRTSYARPTTLLDSCDLG